MTEDKVNDIIGMIYDKLDDSNCLSIKDSTAPNGFYTWVKLGVVREVLREVVFENSRKNHCH